MNQDIPEGMKYSYPYGKFIPKAEWFSEDHLRKVAQVQAMFDEISAKLNWMDRQEIIRKLDLESGLPKKDVQSS